MEQFIHGSDSLKNKIEDKALWNFPQGFILDRYLFFIMVILAFGVKVGCSLVEDKSSLKASKN